MKRSMLIAICGLSLSAQFYDLAATDGGTLYFSSPFTNGPSDGRSKIFKLTGNTLELYRTGTGSPDDFFGQGAILPFATGDGSIVGYSLYDPCRTGSCGIAGLPRTRVVVDGLDLPATYVSLQISHNGRYLLGTTFPFNLTFIDRTTQQTATLPQGLLPAATTQAIADTGAVLLRATNENPPYLVYKPANGEPRRIPGTEGAGTAILSPSGDRIAYERNTPEGYTLTLTGSDGSSHRVLAIGPNNQFLYRPSFASDGTLLYTQPEPYLVPPNGDPRRLLDTKAQAAVIRGDGQVAWVATERGQLLRVSLADGSVEEVIPETPFVNQPTFFGSPGSVLRLRGTGLSPATEVRVGDTVFPFSEYSPGLLSVQIPWEYERTNGTRDLTVASSATPLHQRLTFAPLTDPVITFERAANASTLIAAHQDFRGVVSPDDPALPGETVHIFARNLGPVDRPIATGERSPAAPPARITTPFACYLISVDNRGLPLMSRGIVVPFAGLTGGSVGIYQIDVTVPEDWTAASSMVQCRFDALSNASYRGDSAPLAIR